MMRSVLGQAAIVGVGVAAAVLIIRAQFGAEPLHIQLLAVLAAGLGLGAVQLVLSRRLLRANRLSPRVKEPPPPLNLPERPATRNEGDGGWTGLATPPRLLADTPPPDAISADAHQEDVASTPPPQS
jgi:hypothetical protein